MATREVNPAQAVVDMMNKQAQEERSGRQMTLGRLIVALEAMPEGAEVANLCQPHSYRGYYCDLAFEQRSGLRPAADLLDECRGAMGRTFEGYKGGDFMMGESTPCWVSDYGEASGERLMDIYAGGGLGISPEPWEI